MSLINYIRATVFHNIDSAFSLAIKNPERYEGIFNKIHAIKSDNLHTFKQNNTDPLHYKQTLYMAKGVKYDVMKNALTAIKVKEAERAPLLNYANQIPRPHLSREPHEANKPQP